MAPFRPANLNKRLVSSTGGNGGQIGPTKTPYCNPFPIGLGCRYQGGANQGLFKLNESYCGTKSGCLCPLTDCAGYFFCCSGTAKYFISPFCADCCCCRACASCIVGITNSLMGSLGWFFPCYTIMTDGYACRQYIDNYCAETYWSSSVDPNYQHFFVNCATGGVGREQFASSVRRVRAFRCTAS